ncbi:MAG: M15 family metallopeptidase [Candidatus Acidiferrum sp.]
MNKSRPRPPQLLLLCFCIFLAAAPLLAQTATPSATSLIPGPKPADVPLEWKQLVGIYGQVKEPSFVILERNGSLIWHQADGKESPITPMGESRYDFAPPSMSARLEATTHQDSAGRIAALTLAGEEYIRTDAGADPAHFFYVTPAKTVEELRASALAAKPPQEIGPFRKPDLVELTTLDPAFHLDIRYAQSNNFLSTPLYTQARAFLQRPAAEALLRVMRKLQPLGYGLLIHDAYRPWYITKVFWDATPPKDHSFVADPQKGSKHNRGCAVDLTLYDLATGKAIEMPGLYDEMSPRSFPAFPGGTSLQRWHRDLLRRAMKSEGFTVDQSEWWHFDYKEWKLYPILNVPFEKLDRLAN